MTSSSNYNGIEGPGFFAVLYQKINEPKIITDSGDTLFPGFADYTFFDYFQEHYSNTILNSQTTPFFIYTGLGSIRQLENLILKSADRVLLNQKGLDIYLFENLTFTKEPTKKFYITENKEYSPRDYDFTAGNFSYEFESIKLFVKQNNLINVTVYTCEYNSSSLQNNYPEFQIKTQDIFLLSLLAHTEGIPNSHQHNPLLDFSSETIQCKFWSGNWRYDIHRHLTALYLVDKSSVFSWSYNTSIQDIKTWVDLSKFDFISNDSILCNGAPWTIDINPNITGIDNGQLYTTPNYDGIPPNAVPLPLESYQCSFLAIVTESLFAHPLGTITEKTFNAIKSKRPFILLSSPYSLEYLKSLGFKTFSNFWDESYDQETDHQLRLEKIFKTLDSINAMTIDQLRRLYDDIKPILDHNFSKLNTLQYA